MKIQCIKNCTMQLKSRAYREVYSTRCLYWKQKSQINNLSLHWKRKSEKISNNLNIKQEDNKNHEYKSINSKIESRKSIKKNQ